MLHIHDVDVRDRKHISYVVHVLTVRMYDAVISIWKKVCQVFAILIVESLAKGKDFLPSFKSFEEFDNLSNILKKFS